jgi:hypothetical protein
MRNAYKVLVRKHEGKRPLERPTGRWEDNIKMYVQNRVREYIEFTWLSSSLL